MSATDFNNLQANGLYVNVHSGAFPGGNPFLGLLTHYVSTGELVRRLLARAQNEAAEYWNEACRSYVKALEKLGKCGSAEEVMAIQTELANETVTRFWDESRKATELMGEAISAVTTPGRSISANHNRV